MSFIKNRRALLLAQLTIMSAAPLRVLADQLQNPLCGNSSTCDTSILSLLQNILQAAMYLGVPIAILFVVIAGMKFVFAQGDTTKLKDARTNLLYTIAGIMIFYGASLITDVLITTLRQFGVQLGF